MNLEFYSRDRRGYLFVKRAIDLCVSLVGLVVLSPLFLLIALFIKLDSKGPAIFRQIRLGKGKKPFLFYKFRSMHNEAEEMKEQLLDLSEVEGPIFKIRKDPRITKIGWILRRSSLDELPQLINIIKGEMSLVGPRPPLPDEVEKYNNEQLRRLSVTPGITCLWQISGRSEIGFDRWVELDLEYIDNRSLWLDLSILIRTIPAVISAKGAY